MQITIKNTVKQGLSSFKKNIKFFIILNIFMLLISIPTVYLDKKIISEALFILAYNILIVFPVTWILITHNCYQAVTNQKLKFNSLLLNKIKANYLKFIILFVSRFIAVAIGFFCLIIPGIFIAYKTMFAEFYLVVKGNGPLDSFNKSLKATEGHTFNIFVISILLVVSNIISLVIVNLGFILLIPLLPLTLAQPFLVIYKIIIESISNLMMIIYCCMIAELFRRAVEDSPNKLQTVL